ncbi:MAG: hypothetical protein HYV35_02150 [Lentisphaerae bacterium]|nr:hypothetical protein [Lentisphaerota bacterium]
MVTKARSGWCFALVAAALLQVGHAPAAYVQVGLPLKQLPQDHAYQQQIRAFLGTLSEKDFAVERNTFTVGPTNAPGDPDQLFQLWLLSLWIPSITPVAQAAGGFTLSALESQPGILLPAAPNTSDQLAWLANWDYPGNPYRGSRAIKLRAFVLAAVDLMMLDALYEHAPQGAARSDYLGGNLIWIGYTYSVVKDILPAEVLAAFEAGIKKQVLRLNKWGPTGAMTDMDLFAPVGLSYIAQASSDPEIKQVAQDYSRKLFSDERYFHPAGYFVDNGCFDTSYNGISLYFATWAALSSDWPFVREALNKAFRLRAHLCFPDPDGAFQGPSQMSSRTSAPPPSDQWNFPHRPYAAALVTDEAFHLAPLPSENTIRSASATVINSLNNDLAKAPAGESHIWKESHWYSRRNFAYEHYQRGTYARMLKLANSPLVKPLYRRDENFIREFEKAFVITRFNSYALAIHTGPVGRSVGHNGLPYGYGGGELAAFWTPPAGSVILGRRRGVQGAAPRFDSYAEWRSWPVHAVSGLTAKDELISSTRIQQPAVELENTTTQCQVRVSGLMPKYNKDKTATGPSGLFYERQFVMNSAGLKISTALKGQDEERLTELYETIPVFLRNLSAKNEKACTAIEFCSAGEWHPATNEYGKGVDAVRLRRFAGEVLITFSQPRRVKLSPADWSDGYQTDAACRTVLVDLLEGDGQPQTITNASVSYTISAVPASTKPAAETSETPAAQQLESAKK